MTARGWRMSRPISASHLERKLRSLCGVQGSNPLPDLTDLNGLVTLENDRPEWFLAGGESLRGSLVFTGAALNNLSVNGLFNTTGSGLIAIVERIFCWVSGGAANRVAVAWVDSNPSANSSGIPRDGRDVTGGLGTGAAVGVGGDNSRTPATLIAAPFLLTDFDEFPPVQSGSGGYTNPIVIPPGKGIVVYEVDTLNARVVNSPLTTSYAWRQRPVEGDFDIR